MAVVIVALALGDDFESPISGQYLEAFDFDAFDGEGFGEFTRMREHAKRFPDMIAAMEFWKTQSTVRPLRSDGRPNRPFTATTVTFETVA